MRVITRRFRLANSPYRCTGRTRLIRLTLIASTSSFLATDALTIAIEEAKKGSDVGIYLDLVRLLHEINPSHPLATADKSWTDRKVKLVKAETERLEHELKGYKNNLIKESIRVCATTQNITRARKCRYLAQDMG